MYHRVHAGLPLKGHSGAGNGKRWDYNLVNPHKLNPWGSGACSNMCSLCQGCHRRPAQILWNGDGVVSPWDMTCKQKSVRVAV